MPENVSALQLVLTGDPALLAIVRLSLIVSLSAVVARRRWSGCRSAPPSRSRAFPAARR